jgi:membrane protein implicated in regulation of membrane protease activity
MRPGSSITSGSARRSSSSPRKREGPDLALIFAIFLAVFVLPAGWGVAAILAGMTIEIGEAAFWIRLSQRRRPAIGAEALVGAEGVAVSACRPEGRVRVAGELWRGVCPAGVEAGEPVVVEEVTGLTLRVRPK